MTVAAQGAAYGSTYLTREPYLSTAEFLAAPTGLRLSDIVPANPNNPTPTTEDQDLAVTMAIEDASSWIDELLWQPLAATVQTESLLGRFERDGVLRAYPRQWPIVEVQSASVGPAPEAMAAVTNFANVGLEEQRVNFFPGSVWPTPSFPAIQLGPAPRIPGRDLTIWLTYVAGWPNAFVTEAASSGDTSLSVSTTTGICPPLPSQVGGNATTQMTLYDGGTRERIVATSQDASTGTIQLQSALRANHPVGSRITGLPPNMRRAMLLATAAFIKTRGGGGYLMNSTKGQPQKAPPREAMSERDRSLIAQLIYRYRAVKFGFPG